MRPRPLEARAAQRVGRPRRPKARAHHARESTAAAHALHRCRPCPAPQRSGRVQAVCRRCAGSLQAVCWWRAGCQPLPAAACATRPRRLGRAPADPRVSSEHGHRLRRTAHGTGSGSWHSGTPLTLTLTLTLAPHPLSRGRGGGRGGGGGGGGGGTLSLSLTLTRTRTRTRTPDP